MKFICWKEFSFLRYLSFCVICLGIGCRQESSDNKSIQKTVPLKEVVVSMDTTLVLAKADSFFRLGEKYLAVSKKDSSLHYHEQALALREKADTRDKNMFDSYVKVGGFYSDEFKYDVADKYYEKAQSIVRIKGVPIDEEIKFLLDFSNIKTNLKDIPTAISLLNRLANFVELYHLNDKLILGRIKLALGNAYNYDNQFEQAILDYEQAVYYFDKINDHRLSGTVFFAIGMVYSQMNKNKNAMVNFRKAIQQHLKWTNTESDQLAIVYLQKAVAHRDLHELDSAQYFFRWNLNIRRKVYGEKDPNTFGAKFSLGEFYASTHNYDSAAKYAQECLISLVENFNDPNLQSNPIPEATELNTDLVLGLVSKARALKNLSEKDLREDYLDLALKTYLLADSVFTIFRRNLRYDDPQLRGLEEGYIPYDQMIELTFHLFKKTSNKDYLRRSIEIMEESRAVLLEGALNRAQEYETIKAVHIFRDEENSLAWQRSEILRQLSMSDLSKPSLDSLREALLLVDDTFTELRKVIERTNPGYFNLRYNQKKVSCDEFQKLLTKRNSICVEFLWSDAKIYAMAITPDNIKIKIIFQTDSFKKAFDNFVFQLQATPDKAIKQENFDQFYQSAFILYRALVEDFLPIHLDKIQEPNLIFSANGPLATFPFEALVTEKPETNEVNYKLSYLVKKYPISYTYSPGILIKQSKSDRDGNKLLAMGFAGNNSSPVLRNNLGDLPGTENEINSIKEVMKNNSNRYYLESEATETRFKNQVSNFDIVHLAMHGVADSLNALKSKLVFRSEADTVEDSNLYAHELYNLNLDKLDLAVLSACESGIGKQQKGEGVMSIARGFAYAGCPSLVISLWKIDDRTSAQVMSAFYKHLSFGEDLNKALANAKIDYLRGVSEFNSHPAYWAAFLQVGDTRTISEEGVNIKFWIIGFCFLIVLSALAGWRLRKSS